MRKITQSIKYSAVLVLLLQVYSHTLSAQHEVEFKGGYPVAPTGLDNRPLGSGPFLYATGEGMDIRVDVVARGIEFPSSLVFLPDGTMLLTTRPGSIRVIRDGRLDPRPVTGGPKSYYALDSGVPGAVHGYIDIALHPRFADNHYVYLSYTKPLGDGGNTTALGRGVLDGMNLKDFTDVWISKNSAIGPGRIAFGHDGKLYMTTNTGDAQSLMSDAGKVIRLNDDGSIPADNPFVGRKDALPEIYTYGHRSGLGLAVHPQTGVVWQNENGPNGGDEINVLKPGANYGWPLVSLGRTYPGPWQTADRPTHEGYEPPLVYWMPAIAVSGMTFYTGDALPKWKGDIFVGALRTGEINGTGHLERILINAKYEELRREALLVDLHQRIRDVRQGPDGLLYVVTDMKDGAVLRISTVQP